MQCITIARSRCIHSFKKNHDIPPAHHPLWRNNPFYQGHLSQVLLFYFRCCRYSSISSESNVPFTLRVQ